MKNKLITLLIFTSNFLCLSGMMEEQRPKARIVKLKDQKGRNVILYKVTDSDEKYLSEDVINRLSSKKAKDVQEAYEYLQSMGISECTDRGCNLIRSKNLDRHLFQNKLINFIQSDFSKNQTLIYTSLGSGLLFQDLVILAKLIKQGFKDIHINLIDSMYKEYGGHIYSGISYKGVDEAKRNAIPNFANILQNMPDTQITITVYGSEEDYLSDIKNKKAKMSDVLVSIDAQINFCENEDRALIQQGLKEGGLYASLTKEKCFRNKKRSEKTTEKTKEPSEKEKNKPTKKNIEDMTEEEQLQEAMRRSLQQK